MKARTKKLRAQSSSKTARAKKPPSTRQLLLQLSQRLDKEHDQEQQDPLLADFAKEWLPRYRGGELSPDTYVAYDSSLRRHILPRFGEVLLSDITEDLIDGWKARLLGDKVAPATLNLSLSVLRGLLRSANRWGRLRYVPEIRDVASVRPERPWLKQDELDRLVKAATKMGDGVLLVVLLAGDAGLRASEMRGLRWEDIGDQVIMVRRQRRKNVERLPKGKVGRPIHMTTRLAQLLARLRSDNPSEPVLPGRNGKPLGATGIRRRLLAALRKADPTHRRIMGPHALRHTYLTHLNQNGARLTDIQKLAGHKNLSTTQRYLHTEDEDLAKAVDRLRR